MAAKAEEYRRVVSGPVLPGASYCSIHGEQVGLNCPQCDEKDPVAVADRQIPDIVPSLTEQERINLAVKEALKQAGFSPSNNKKTS